MERAEKIPVYIRIENGKTICLCHAGRKRCGRNCDRDLVTRDRFMDWQATMKQDRFGK